MPVTPRLSRKLHETFGDEAAADMVDWMDRVEAQRAELRELNELNFSRLDARFGQFEARFGQFEATLGQFETRLGQFDARLGQLEVTIVSRVEAKIERRFADLLKWSFVFWCGAVASIAALAGVLR